MRIGNQSDHRSTAFGSVLQTLAENIPQEMLFSKGAKWERLGKLPE